MKKCRKPCWMSAEEWKGYLEQTTAFHARLVQLLRRKIAEARADLDADRDDPDLARWHAARISILLCQIADAEGTALYQQEPERPVIVNAVRSRRRQGQTDIASTQYRLL